MRILIAGLGQLGKRHLQSVASLETLEEVYLIEPYEKNLVEAQEILNQSKAAPGVVVRKGASCSDIGPAEIDVAIIATNSLVRRHLVEDLLNGFSVTFLILEKFLFPEPEDYDAIGKLLVKKNVKAWVNCPRRLYPVYQNLKQQNGLLMSLTVHGTEWGLGCNAIHMFDLCAFIRGQADFAVYGNLLDEEILQSKRSGYIEFTGTLYGHSIDGSTLFKLVSGRQQMPFSICLQYADKVYLINETLKQVTSINVSDQKTEIQSFEVPYQSQLTANVVKDIMNTGSCGLPMYDESAKLHMTLLRVFLDHLNKKTDIPVKQCPIT